MNINSNKIKNDFMKFKKFKYRFLIENLSFSSSFMNDTKVLLMTCIGVNNGKLILINGIENIIFGVINLFQIGHRSTVKSNSN